MGVTLLALGVLSPVVLRNTEAFTASLILAACCAVILIDYVAWRLRDLIDPRP
jgi:hypothetical protein